MKQETLTAKQMKALPRKVIFNNRPDVYWEGKSDGVIHEGLYLKVYPARSYQLGHPAQYKKTGYINVPLTRVYSF